MSLILTVFAIALIVRIGLWLIKDEDEDNEYYFDGDDDSFPGTPA